MGQGVGQKELEGCDMGLYKTGCYANRQARNRQCGAAGNAFAFDPDREQGTGKVFDPDPGPGTLLILTGNR